MNLNITSIEEIESELEYIQEFLSNNEIPDTAVLISEYGRMVSGYATRSGKLLADAKFHCRKATSESILRQVAGELLPATILKMLIESSVKELQYLVDFAERINRDCTHKLDWCRTLLSTEREMMKNRM